MITISVIAAKVYDDRIEIAADSIICNSEDTKRTNFKKLRCFKDMIYGGCGDAEELTLFFRYVETHAIPQIASEADVQEYFYNFYTYKEKYSQEFKSNNTYFIVINKQLFEIEGAFIKRVDDYAACGKGQPYALAALKLGHTVDEAVQVSADLCCYVSEPIVKFVQQ